MRKLKDLFDFGIELLEKEDIENANLDAWYLLEAATGVSKALYFMNKEKMVTKEEEETYIKMLERRREHIPLQYIIGRTEFMGLTFKVNEHVLIPRQDTEVLVEETLKIAKDGMEILDMCTGSGCIIVSLAHFCSLKNAVGVDISKEALKIADENAILNKMKIKWIQSNLFESVDGKYEIIVSNPPYIKTEVIETLMPEVKNFEPRIALDGLEDGLYFYELIVKEARNYLKSAGRLLFEIGWDQGQLVEEIFKKYGYNNIKIIKDLAGLDRVCQGSMPICLEE
ncbi:MAG: peptide chain release factor N(5)-glutamine methyltransferase [Clostridiales bacterium]|nr:peptide chain release factor N(5)-glutamine methyltransferase [Clostridiales bacterium]